MLTILMLLQAATLPILWTEPVDPGRAVTRDDAIGLCATTDRPAIAEMDAMIRNGRPGACQQITGLWHVTRRIEDRCIGMEPGWFMDESGRRHRARSCRVEAHVVEIRQDAAVRLAMVATSEGQLD